MTYKILQLGNPILRKQALPVPVQSMGSKKFQKIIDTLIGTMKDIKSISPYHGNGLAAPQIGYSYQIICLYYKRKYQVIINPVITYKSGKRFKYSEGCLSFFYLRSDVTRYAEVKVTGYDETGEALNLHFEGDLAGFLQHEVDHINGILYIDRLSNNTQLMSVDEKYKNQPEKLAYIKKVINLTITIV